MLRRLQHAQGIAGRLFRALISNSWSEVEPGILHASRLPGGGMPPAPGHVGVARQNGLELLKSLFTARGSVRVLAGDRWCTQSRIILRGFSERIVYMG